MDSSHAGAEHVFGDLISCWNADAAERAVSGRWLLFAAPRASKGTIHFCYGLPYGH